MFQNMPASLVVLLSLQVTMRRCEQMRGENISTTKTVDTLCLPTRSEKLKNTKQLEQRRKRKANGYGEKLRPSGY